MRSECVTIWVYRFGQVERIRGGKVGVGRRDGQDETGLLADELHDHVADLLLDVDRLVSHRDLGQSRQVNQGYVKYCSRQKSGTRRGNGKRDKRTRDMLVHNSPKRHKLT